MKLVFSGLQRPIEIQPGVAAVVQVANQSLFARFAMSLQSGAGVDALEPYTLWSGETELRSRGAFLFVSDPLNLPWDDKRLIGEVVKRMEREFLEDEDLRQKMEAAEQALAASFFDLSAGLDSSYGFNAEWDFKRYLKMVGFGAIVQPDEPLLDRLITFLSLVVDSGCDKVLVFVNLKTFLTENEVQKLYDHVFYTNLPVLLLENKTDGNDYRHETKRVIDQDFIEL